MTIAPAAPRTQDPDLAARLFPALAARHDRCFWLDGAATRPWAGNRSLVGWLDEADTSITYDAARGEVTRHAGGRSTVVGTDVFDVLRTEIARAGDDGLWAGYFGYACRPDLPSRPASGAAMPDAVWMHTRHVQVVEHPVAAARPGGPPTSSPTTGAPTEEYAAAFAAVQEHLHAGDSYEVNLTHRIDLVADLAPVDAYLRLRAVNPAPYAGLLQHRGHWLLSSSPERYATIDADRTIETRPIKGTTPRGSTLEEDERLARLLKLDPKFRAENLMIVDLLRNDLGMVCEAGSVVVPQLMAVESYPSVHQLVSTVRGRLRDGVDTIDALRTLFPAGSMTGAPKLRTMEIIREVERTPRGVYSGAFGWIAPDGRADLGVVIRSLTTAGDGRWQLGTGGGITVQSDLHEEYAECQWKAERLRRALDG